MALDAVQIGGWLRAARERQGTYSQEQAAAQVGATARTVYSWEQGKGALPVDTFFKLVALYGADVNDLLKPKDPRGSRPAEVRVIARAAGRAGKGAAG